MKLPDRGQAPRKPADDFVAAEEAGRLGERAADALSRADGVDWYEENGTAIDEAAFALARLRRAEAGLRGRPAGRRRGRPAGARAGEPRVRALAREPRRLVHGRVGISGGGRALVPAVAGSARLIAQDRIREGGRRCEKGAASRPGHSPKPLLSVAPPEQEPQRQEDRAGEIGRERDPVALLSLDDRRAVAERSSSRRDRTVERRPRRRRGRRACRPPARGWRASADRGCTAARAGRR